MLEILAVIPARGDSKGIPRKNLALVGGRTLVGRAAAAALGARLVTRVVGSTDDQDIATELRAAGVEVPWLRPAELAGDEVGDGPVFLHALRALEADGYLPDIVVNVRPTAPLRSSADIDAALQFLLDHPDCESVKSVSAVSEHPYKMWTICDGLLQSIVPHWVADHGGDVDAPRQSLPAVLRSNGAVDAVWARALLATERFHPGPIAAYVMDARRAVDVDTDDDLRLAEQLLEEVS